MPTDNDNVIPLHAKCDKVAATKVIVESYLLPTVKGEKLTALVATDLKICAGCLFSITRAFFETAIDLNEEIGFILNDLNKP